jgi:hypothetical protein
MPLDGKARNVDVNYSRGSQNLIYVKFLLACNISLLVLCPKFEVYYVSERIVSHVFVIA